MAISQSKQKESSKKQHTIIQARLRSLACLVNNNMQSNVIKYFNANPWKKNIPDCAIRAVVMAIGMKYELVCEAFGAAWKRGRGLIRDTGI